MRWPVRVNRYGGPCSSGPCKRSIPAGAGKPVWSALMCCQRWVYPRGCGEAPLRPVGSGPGRGLSPRVRGSHAHELAERGWNGSIPAGAGKPYSAHGNTSSHRVYPRGCGEATMEVTRDTVDLGLSPRVRGSQSQAHPPADKSGSIPAGAGKPRTRPRSCRRPRVYPRGCGEANLKQKLTYNT